MRTGRVLFLLLLLALPSSAATTKVVPTTPPRRRYRIGDADRARPGGFLARIENCLPVALLIFLGFRGNVQVSGNAGNVSVSAGHGGGR